MYVFRHLVHMMNVIILFASHRLNRELLILGFFIEQFKVELLEWKNTFCHFSEESKGGFNYILLVLALVQLFVIVGQYFTAYLVLNLFDHI